MPFLDLEYTELLANFSPSQRSRHVTIAARLLSVGWNAPAASCLAVLQIIDEDDANKISERHLTEPVQSSVRKSPSGKDEPLTITTR